MAEEQYWTLQNIPAKRGDILSSDGFPLATTQVSYLLYGEPKKIKNPLQVAYDIAKVLTGLRKNRYEDNAERDAYFESLKSHFYEVLSLDLGWVAMEHYLSEEERTAVLALGVEGLGFEGEPRRYYPEGTLAAHVMGFVGKDEHGEELGYFGIEGNFDGDLKGRPGKIIEEQGATGEPILVGEYRRAEPINGRNIVLTINRAVQYIVEKKLEEGVRKYGAASGSVIVMDPFTGDVIAMATFPTYDPGKFNELTEGELDEESKEISYAFERKNLAISQTYEPGSVMKPFTISTAVDLGKVTPQTTFEDNGPVVYSDYTINTWNGVHYGTQTVIQLLQKSNNIGAAWVGHLVGSRNLSNYLQTFGFGEVTGIDLEGEDTGIIRPYREWTDIDLATASFGQGVSATPLQVLNGFNAIANGGELFKPRIVSSVIQGSSKIDIPVNKTRDVISKGSSDTMVGMLIEAVDGGESKYFNLKNYKIAGKTGTAQIPVGGKYDPELTNATFMGFPATTRKFSMIVKLEKPSSSIFAAETAVPMWMDLANNLFKYYGIAPDSTI